MDYLVFAVGMFVNVDRAPLHGSWAEVVRAQGAGRHLCFLGTH